MFRRWFGIALIAWASVAALVSYVPTANTGSALAAGEQYQFTNATTIQGTGGGLPTTINFACSGKTCIGSYSPPAGRGFAQHYTFTITIGNKGATGGYQATVAAKCVSIAGQTCGTPSLDKTTTIADPNGVGPGGGSTGTTGGTATAAQCTGGQVIGWFICGIIDIAVHTIDYIVKAYLIPFLQEQPLTTTTQVTSTNAAGATVTNTIANPVYTIWSRFRDVASVFFILLFFIVIFGTALGIDNYTVKRILPRLVAGAILVPLSWYICAIVIDIGNVLGQGLVALMSKIVAQPTIDFTTPLSSLFFVGGVVAGALVATTALATIGFGVLISFGLALLTAVAMIIFRRIVIILLVILSPFALIAWILPNTERLYQRWWTMLTRLILMYPLMMLLIEAGRIFSLTAQSVIATGSIGIFGLHVFFGAGTGAQAVQQAFVPFAVLAGEAISLVSFKLTFDWAKKDLEFGGKAIRGARSFLDSRIGGKSDFGQNMRENRQRRNLLRTNPDARWSFNRLRSGQGFAGFRGGAGRQIAAHEALDKATAFRAKANAIRRERGGAAGDPETNQQRIDAETQSEVYKMAEARAGREGVRRSVAGAGVAADQLSRERYFGGVETSTQSEAAKIGVARGAMTGARVRGAQGVDVQGLMDHAQYTEEGKQAGVIGTVQGSVQAVTDIDATLGGLDTRSINMADAARIKAQGDVAQLHGDALAKIDVEGAGAAETTIDMRDAARTAAVEKEADAKAVRQQRNEIQGLTLEDADEVLEASTEHARESLGKASNDRRAAREVETRTNENTERFLNNDYGRAEGAAFDAANARTQRGQAEREAAGLPAGTNANNPLPAAYSGTRFDASQEAARRAANTDVGKRDAILNDTVGGAANTTNADYRTAAAYNESRAQGAKSGDVQSVLVASAADAARPAAGAPGGAMQAAAYRASQAARIAGTKKAGEAIGNDQAQIDANLVVPVDAGASADQAQRTAGAKLAAEHATTTEGLAQAQLAEQARAVEMFGPGYTAAQLETARQDLLTNASDKAGFEARDATAAALATTAAAVRGRNQAVARESARSGVGAPQAEQNLVGNAAQVAANKAAKEVAAAASTNTGILGERESAIQAEISQGRAANATAAGLNLAENAAETARLKGAEDTRKTLAGERGTLEGHQEAVEEQIRRTTPAVGPAPSAAMAERALSNTLRDTAAADAAHHEVTAAGEAVGKEEERERVIDREVEGGRAGAGTPAAQRTQARRNVTQNASEKARLEGVNATRKAAAGERGTAEGHQEAIDEEIARAAAAGAPIPGTPADQRVIAERNLGNTLNEDATADVAHSVVTAAGSATGRERERERAVQKEVDERGGGGAPADERRAARGRLTHNASEESRIEAADSERKKIGAAQGVAGSEQTEADDEIDLAGAEEIAADLAAAGLANTLPNRRRVALERVRRRDINNNASNAGNARTGKTNEIRGTVERRNAAVAREMAGGATVEQAGRNIERKVAIAETKEAADKYDRGLASALGTADAAEAAVHDQAGTTTPTSAQSRAARGAISDQNFEKSRREAAEKTSGEVGQTAEENAAATTDEAAVELELAQDMRNRNGGIAPTQAELDAELPREMQRRARLAGGEVGARAQATKSGRTEALAQAARSTDRPTTTDRRAASSQREIDASAKEAAGVSAYNARYIQRRDFETSLRANTGTQTDQLLNQGVNEASSSAQLWSAVQRDSTTGAILTDPTTGEMLPATGATPVRLKDMLQGGRERDIVQADAVRAMAEQDYYRAIADMEHLATGPSGSAERIIALGEQLFGRDDFRPANPAANGLPPEVQQYALTLYNRVVEKAKDADLKLAPRVAYDNFGADMLTGNSHRFDERAIGYISDTTNFYRRANGTTMDPANPADATDVAKQRDTRHAQRQQAASALGEIFKPGSGTKFDSTRRAKVAQLMFSRNDEGQILDAAGNVLTVGSPPTPVTNIFEKDYATGNYALTDTQRTDIANRAGIDAEIRDIMGRGAFNDAAKGDEIVADLKQALTNLRA